MLISKQQFDKGNIVLTGDNKHDGMFFKDTLDELSFTAALNSVNNGAQLINFPENDPACVPDILFPDFNIPHRAGIVYLSEIKQGERF